MRTKLGAERSIFFIFWIKVPFGPTDAPKIWRKVIFFEVDEREKKICHLWDASVRLFPWPITTYHPLKRNLFRLLSRLDRCWEHSPFFPCISKIYHSRSTVHRRKLVYFFIITCSFMGEKRNVYITHTSSRVYFYWEFREKNPKITQFLYSR